MDNRSQRALIIARRRREQARRRKIRIICGVVACVLVVGGVAFAMNATHQKSSDTQNTSSQETSTLPVTDEKKSESTTTTQNASNIVMTIKGDKNTQVLKGEQYLEAGCHAVDTTKQENINDVKASGSVDTSKTGEYEITYTATDSSGNKATATRKVTVVDSFEGGNAAYLPVCMYHYVYDETNKPDEVDNNWIEASLLEKEIAWTKENNFYYPSYEEVRGFVDGTHSLPAKCIVFTFDDGKPEFLDSGVKLFDKYEVPATSFVIACDADAKEKVFSHASQYVEYQSHSYAMHQAGSNVGRGGRIHACTYDEIKADQLKAVELLGNSQAYAYPFGDNNDTAHEALKDAGVITAFTIENRMCKPGDDPMALPRVRINGSYSFETFCAMVS